MLAPLSRPNPHCLACWPRPSHLLGPADRGLAEYATNDPEAARQYPLEIQAACARASRLFGGLIVSCDLPNWMCFGDLGPDWHSQQMQEQVHGPMEINQRTDQTGVPPLLLFNTSNSAVGDAGPMLSALTVHLFNIAEGWRRNSETDSDATIVWSQTEDEASSAKEASSDGPDGVRFVSGQA